MKRTTRVLASLLISGILTSVGSLFCLSQGNLPVLTKAEDVRSLTLSRAVRGYPVRIQGIITYADADGPMLFVQDESSGIQIELDQQNHALKPGQVVEIEGYSSSGNILPIVSKAQAKIIGSREFPPARPTQLAQLDLKRDDSQWMRLKGLVIQNVYEEAHYTVLDACAGQHRIQIRMRGFSHEAASSLIDAKIEVQGVLGVTTDSAHNPTGLILWVPEGLSVSILSKPLVSPSQLPLTPIAALEKSWKKNPPEHRIRIQGIVMPGQRENVLLVQDKTGIIAAQALFSRPIAPGDEVELTGFADQDSPVPRIINATYLRIKAPAIQSTEESGLPTLTQIRQIRDLDPQQAARGYPVKIRGIITYHNPQLSMTFIQNGESAIYLQNLDPSLVLFEGKEYEVEGFSAPGDFAPIIIKPKYRLIGPATIPAARYVTLDQLSSGQYDCLRVQVRGIVRSVRQIGNRWRLDLYSDGKGIQVWTPYFLANSVQVLSLQDAKILTQGICSIQISAWGAISGFRLNVPSAQEIKVEEPAQSDLFSVPLRSIRDVFRYQNPEEAGRRIRIQGTLLHQQPGKALYIQDASGAISIPVDHVIPASSNDIVMVSGYPASGTFAPILEHAVVKRVGPGSPPRIRVLQDARALNNNFNGDIVRIRARLVDQARSAEGQSYFLQDLVDSHTSFEAFFESSAVRPPPAVLRNGSELELTGVYLLRMAGTEKFGFQILLRTSEDIRLIKSAPWWTLRHLYWAFGILLCLILIGSVWALTLKKRVNRQTKIIQQRLEVEAALEKKYRELFEGSHDIVFACDETGRLRSINPAGSQILAYSNEELLAMDPRQLIAPSCLPKIIEWIEQKSKGIECPNLECELIAKGGHQVLIEVSAEIFMSDGKIAGAQGIARDITERKQAEEALRQSEEKLRQGQKLESIGRLAGGIAHDFNNILSAILGYAELSLDDISREHPVRSNLDQIVKAGKRARNLVQQILAFSRKLEQERRPIHLHAIVDEALQLLKATLPTTIEISTNIHSGCSPILADPTQMHQIILNLATNAAHAIGDHGGCMKIELEQVSLNGHFSTASGELMPGTYIRLSISDTGPGIPPEVQKRIFEPYFTTKSVGQGSGLGLAVVHGIVQSHGGGISVANMPGSGACFEVYLPCCSEKPSSTPAQAPEIVKGKGHILLVDDEEAIVNLNQRLLEKLGYSVTGETHSVAALEKFSKNPEQFDLVVTDQTMPNLTGLALAKELWKIRPDLPVIISTGYSAQITSEKISGLGFYAMLNKPYTSAELAKAVKQSLTQ
jgi:PAS domain S-box-containing protein